MFDAGHDFALCRTVGSQLVSDHDAGWVPLSFEKLSHQTLGGLGVAAALHQHVENETILIDSSPKPVFLSTELKNKRMVPIRARLKARSMERFGALVRHGGEEFLYVLEGAIEVHSEFYSPISLAKGEGVYLDSTMGHAYISTSAVEAEILCICTEAEFPETDGSHSL